MSAAIDLSHLPERARNSRPNMTGFCPDGIPYQNRVLRLVRRDFDYDTGNLEILLSGSYGSAKSVLLAHLAITHCLMYRRARCAIVRRALPDLKATLFKEILEHLEDTGLVEGRDYWVNYTRASVRFKNRSEIVAVYWADRKYKRVRSLKLSMVLIEEGAENDTQDKEGFDEIKARLRRLPHVPENVLIVATNPGSPAHWLYDYFIAPNEGGVQHATRYVFYSRTEQNPYLPPIYITQLRRDLDPRRARRYLDGEWIELTKDQVYYAYSSTENYRARAYEYDFKLPLFLCWDFNIGVGKPLSVALMQYDAPADTFHFPSEVVVEGMRTLQALEVLADRGVLDMPFAQFIVAGDAAGKHKDTRSLHDDYEIIMAFPQNYRTKDGRALTVEKWVPVANPPVRERHNRTNAYCLNALGQRRLFVYRDAPTLHKGLRLVELRKRGEYIEDDSKDYQHVTTAAGYGIMAVRTFGQREPQNTRIL